MELRNFVTPIKMKKASLSKFKSFSENQILNIWVQSDQKKFIFTTTGVIQVKVDVCVLLVALNLWLRFKKEHSIYVTPCHFNSIPH